MSVGSRSPAAAAAAAVLYFLALPAVDSAASAREVVAFDGGVSAGTIVVRTNERRLYFVLGGGQAIRYPVGVGRAGRQWSGQSRVDGKYVRPDWAPPPEIMRDHPRMPRLIRGGAPNNPMGVAALTLSGGEYAIHGTNNPEIDRRLRVLRLHPHVQPGHRRSVRSGQVGTPVVVAR